MLSFEYFPTYITHILIFMYFYISSETLKKTTWKYFDVYIMQVRVTPMTWKTCSSCPPVSRTRPACGGLATQWLPCLTTTWFPPADLARWTVGTRGWQRWLSQISSLSTPGTYSAVLLTYSVRRETEREREISLFIFSICQNMHSVQHTQTNTHPNKATYIQNKNWVTLNLVSCMFLW